MWDPQHLTTLYASTVCYGDVLYSLFLDAYIFNPLAYLDVWRMPALSDTIAALKAVESYWKKFDVVLLLDSICTAGHSAWNRLAEVPFLSWDVVCFIFCVTIYRS
jgi:hypothetical protein